MRKLLFLTLSIFAMFSCNSSKTEKPYWAYKAGLQNALYVNETEKHLNQNVTQLIKELESQSKTQVLDTVLTLHEHTNLLIKYLNLLEEQMVEINGGRDFVYGTPLNREVAISLQEQFIDNGVGKELQAKLIEYSKMLSSYGLAYNTIAVEPQNVPQLKHDPAFHKDNFIELHFGDRNIFEAQSSIEYFKVSILLKEITTIGLIAGRN